MVPVVSYRQKRELTLNDAYFQPWLLGGLAIFTWRHTFYNSKQPRQNLETRGSASEKGRGGGGGRRDGFEMRGLKNNHSHCTVPTTQKKENLNK